MIRKTGILLLTLLFTGNARAQERKLVEEGNKLYLQGKYKEAAAAYQKALQRNPNYTPGKFNLGNALYQQEQYDAARQALAHTAKSSKDSNERAGANYNIGNTYMKEQKWQEAVDAYKAALRRNPQDADAKYNLSYATEKLKQQQQNQDKKKDKNKDKNKDKKDQDKKDKKEDPQKKEQDKQDPQKSNQPDQKEGDQKKEQQPQGQPSKLSQQQADQLLNALQQEEKKLQDKMQKVKGTPVRVEKDW